MQGRLQDKTALITGAGSGIGRAMAQVFSREGARVAIADIDEKAARETLEIIGGNGMVLKLDVSSRREVQQGFVSVIETFGHLDILVNNAGCVSFSTFEESTEEDWDRVMNVNLKGPYLCCQAVLAHMRSRKTGVIINLSSLAAKSGGLAAGPSYAASKAGVSALTISLARTLAPHGVRVVALAPGIIDTPMTSSGRHDQAKQQIPLGAAGKPEDVANCALFLASGEARHITGEILDVNGGLWMD